MEENKDEMCSAFVGILENKFTNVKVEKEESDDLNSLKGNLLKDIEIKEEKIEDEEILPEVCKGFYHLIITNRINFFSYQKL